MRPVFAHVFFGWHAFLTSCFMKVQNPSERMYLKWVEELFAKSVGLCRRQLTPVPEGSFPVWPAVTVASPPQLFHTLLLIPGVGSKWTLSKCFISVPSFTLKMPFGGPLVVGAAWSLQIQSNQPLSSLDSDHSHLSTNLNSLNFKINPFVSFSWTTCLFSSLTVLIK